MIPTPEVFADGHVLPAISTEEILSNPANHNSVPMILGTNRDEPSLFMFSDPRHLDLSSEVPRLKDEARYLREVKYGALSSKRRGVDSLATYMTAAGNRDVYAYRFDWDEEGVVDGRDLSVALGAGHALEIAFVFGDFETGLPLGEFFQNSPEKELLAASMMSYWSQFAATGNPGRGQSGDGVEWLSWDAHASTTLVLDTPSDQGIYMTDGVVSAASIKAELAADPEIADALERCTHYSRIFAYSPHFDADEYADFGPDGCAQFDPAEIRGF
ncbi:MAG: carboxylesterase family protein [Gammaproteobacteria bacterium]|nr:carboxylesterase family protein [Gammaproteobacteria bacterium]